MLFCRSFERSCSRISFNLLTLGHLVNTGPIFFLRGVKFPGSDQIAGASGVPFDQ